MGAAFLAHQVKELERSVDSLSFSRDGADGRRGGRGGRAGGGHEHGHGHGGRKELRVLDASVLVHALPVVKRWVREDSYQLVVPLEGEHELLLLKQGPDRFGRDLPHAVFSTLDILKRAQDGLHDLAREATRFLETQLDIARQITSDATPDSRNPDPRIRLRAQAAKEELAWADVEKLFRVPEGYVALAALVPPLPLADGETPPEPASPTANDIPRTLRSTLQCALFFLSLPTAPEIAVHNLPSTLPYTPTQPPTHTTPHRSNGSQPAQQPDFAALSSGTALSYFLSTFFPAQPVYAVSTSEIVAAREWAKALAQARSAENDNGRGGRGSGGRGRGGRGREEDGRGRGGGRRGAHSGGRAEGPPPMAPRSLFVP